MTPASTLCGALAAVVVAGALTACSSSPEPSYTADDAPGVDRSSTEPSASGKPSAKKNGSAKSGQRRARSTAGSGGDGSSDATGGSGPSGGSGSTSKPAVSCMSDGAGDQDRSGSPPAYTDLTRACVRAAGSSIRFELTLNGSAPAAMPNDDTVLTLGFSLPRGDSGSSVQAEVDTGGWSAYLTHGQGRTRLSGLRVDGRSVSITVPASQLPASLRWKAESSWTKSTMLTTSYAFDTAPDIGTATFSR